MVATWHVAEAQELIETPMASRAQAHNINGEAAAASSLPDQTLASPCLSVVWQSRWGLPIGYAVSSEALALELVARGVDLMYRPTPWHMLGTIRHPMLRAVAARMPRNDAPQVSYDQADLFYTGHAGYKIGYTMLEVDGLPREWVAACNTMDEVWTPSRWGATVFANAGVTRPIYVMPLGYDPARFRPDGPARRITGRFTFLSVFEWGERKAPDVLLRAYAAAFTRRDDVVLILRVNNFDAEVDVARQIAALRLPANAPPIVLLYNRHISDESLGALYRSADCFVLPTRGEGWGLPILEAMACGLPVIATDWSGQTEFLHRTVGYPLRVRRLVAADAKCPYYLGWQWAEPDIEHLVALMRHVYDHPDEARRVGARAAQETAARWTWAHAAERIHRRLTEILRA
ncbi:MAG: glycosyltransferase [Roseiflexus sp.]|nr:glycosyltransferase [Roseiflexus sp.]MDW8148513.1 glycosyltransferase [Roseiflexaceae bacterium]MDW8231655.1 glycosyltransferase [Roseiflexaceae bacterium]